MVDRLAVVSGGGSGIGLEIAATLAREGADVVILGRRAGPLAAAAEQLGAAGGGRVRAVVADLADPEQVEQVGVELAAAGRPVDVLVNNAGGNLAPAPPGTLGQVAADWLLNVRGNVLPVVLLTHAVQPLLRRPGGRVVTVSSVAAFRGPATYGGAKAALHPWSAELAARLAPEGIAVNVVAPGFIDGTEFYGDRMSPEFHADRAAKAPMNRAGTAREVAALVSYLAGPDGGFVTGQVLQVNGGAVPGRG